MKSRIFIVLALVGLMAALWGGVAGADSLRFVTQPTVGTFDGDMICYPVSWETDFVPVKVERYNVTKGDVDNTYHYGMDRALTFNFYSGTFENTYTMRVYYDGAHYVESTPFTLPYGADLVFTQQPTVGAFDGDMICYPVSWETSFVPRKVERYNVTKGDVDNTYNYGMDRALKYNFNSSTFESTYTIRAYYDDTHYVESDPFTLPYEADLVFTQQPTAGAFDGDMICYPVSWETSFAPRKAERYNVTNAKVDNTYHYGMSRALTYNFNGSTFGSAYTVRAYYDDTHYVESNSFTLPYEADLVFTQQPTVGAFNEYITCYPVSWKTSFVPHKVERYNVTNAKVDNTYHYGMDRALTYNFNSSTFENAYTVRAYYNDTHYIESIQFPVKTSPCVTFDLQGHGEAIAPVYLPSGSAVTRPADPSDGDWLFGGWYADAAFTQKYNFTVPVTEDVTLYAWWGHRVTFDLNGKGVTSAAFNAQRVRDGGCAVMPAAYTLQNAGDVWQGWYIGGWYMESGCKNRYDFAQPVADNVTLYANWVYDGYTVTYNWNGDHHVTRYRPVDGTHDTIDPDESVTRRARTGQSFTEIVPLSYDLPTVTAFAGWYTDPACTVKYDFSSVPTSDMTLYAGWAANYTVTAHYTAPDGSAPSTSSYIIPHGSVPADDSWLSYALSGAGRYQGFTAGGWYVDQALTTPFDPTAPLTADVHIYNKWVVSEHTVTFDVNGGAGMENAACTLRYGDAITPPADLPTRQGYVCKGWNTSAAAAYALGFADVTCTGDVTYYAVWVPEGVAIDARSFPDDNFRAYVSGKSVDTDQNGYLTNAELEAVKSISYDKTAEDQKISSLMGIEYFTNLQRLWMPSQSLTQLSLNRNTQLTSVTLSSTPTLTSLDVSGCINLTELTVNLTGLTSLNLVNNTALQALECRDSASLTALTLRSDALKKLVIYNSGIATLDISACPILCETVLNGKYSGVTNIYYAYYTHPQGSAVGSIQVTNAENNTTFITGGVPIDEAHFPDAAFRGVLGTAFYDKNQNGVLTDDEIADITSLSGADGMHSLRGMEYLPNVSYIVINDVGLTDIDLTGNPLIDTLVVKGNALTSLDASMLPLLTHLDVADNPGLSAITLGATPLETLNCYACPLIRSLDLSTQPALLKAYVDGDGYMDEYDGLTCIQYSWANEDETQLSFLRVDPDISIALPEWMWSGASSADFIMPNGDAYAATVTRSVCADGRFVTFTAEATVSGISFTDETTLCRVTFEGAEVPEQLIEVGDYVAAPTAPVRTGYVFDGWFADEAGVTPYLFGEPVTQGFTLYAGWTAEASMPGSVELSHVNFPDPVFRAYVCGFDLNGNGWLNQAEIDQVNEIILERVDGLYSLAGVEYLTAIDSVIVYDAPDLTTLDLSNNTALWNVDVCRTGLTALDVSNLRLTYLSISDNQLATLALGSQPNLLLMYTQGNRLESLDISGCPTPLKLYMQGDKRTFDTMVLHYDSDSYLQFTVDVGVRVITGHERTVRFDALGGTPEPDAQTVMAGESAAEPAAPMAAGRVFTGWYTDEACTAESRYDFDAPVTAYMTLYAGWTIPEPVGMLALPAGLTAIEEEAFAGIPAEAVIVPADVTDIAGNPFADSGVKYIYGFTGSAAQTLANACGFIFVPIDDDWLASR